MIGFHKHQSKITNKIEEIHFKMKEETFTRGRKYIQIPFENKNSIYKLLYTQNNRVVHTSIKIHLWKVVDFAHLYSGALFPSPHFPTYVPKVKEKNPQVILLSMAAIKLNAIYIQLNYRLLLI